MRKQELILLAAALTSALVAIGSGTARASSSVTYDATGGAKCANCHTLSWGHTVSGSNTVLLVGIGVGIIGDGSCSASVTYSGIAMASLARTCLQLVRRVRAGLRSSGATGRCTYCGHHRQRLLADRTDRRV